MAKGYRSFDLANKEQGSFSLLDVVDSNLGLDLRSGSGSSRRFKDKIDMAGFGEYLRIRMAEVGITNEELAAMVRTTPHKIQQYRDGECYPCSFNREEAIVNALKDYEIAQGKGSSKYISRIKRE